MKLSKQQIKFLIGLNKLTQETGVAIGGCGCCNSPYLINIEDYNKDKEEFELRVNQREIVFDNSKSGYACENDGGWIRWINELDSSIEYYKDKIVYKDYKEG